MELTIPLSCRLLTEVESNAPLLPFVLLKTTRGLSRSQVKASSPRRRHSEHALLGCAEAKIAKRNLKSAALRGAAHRTDTIGGRSGKGCETAKHRRAAFRQEIKANRPI